MLDTTNNKISQRLCEHCGKEFERRKHSGGSPQRFCSQRCRLGWRTSQRGPASNAATLGPGVAEPRETENAPEPTVGADSEFDWSADDGAVVLQEQAAVAVYWNANGGLTIRQQRDWCQHDDQIVVMAAESVGQFVDRLTEIAELGISEVGR